MIDYLAVQKNDILRIVGVGAPGYAQLGDLVRVKETHSNSVIVENRDGKTAEFMYNCGATRLETTEWKQDFSESMFEKSKDGVKLTERVSTIPCCICGGEVVEFTVPNDIWNLVMRPDGKETNREYLCFDCWYKALQIKVSCLYALNIKS